MFSAKENWSRRITKDEWPKSSFVTQVSFKVFWVLFLKGKSHFFERVQFANSFLFVSIFNSNSVGSFPFDFFWENHDDVSK